MNQAEFENIFVTRPALSRKDFMRILDIKNELFFRIEEVGESMMLYRHFGTGLKEKRLKEEVTFGKDNLIEDRLRYIVTNYAILQMMSVLDCNGSFSLCVRKTTGEYNFAESKLKKLFPIVTGETSQEVTREINSVLRKHKNIIDLIKKNRDEKIAHASKVTHKILVAKENDDEYPYFVRKSIIPTRFSYERLYKFALDLKSSLGPIRYDIEDYGYYRGWI